MGEKLRMARRVSWGWTYQRTMDWMRTNQPGSLLFAPIVFPLIFALMFYEQYKIQFVMAALERLAGLFRVTN